LLSSFEVPGSEVQRFRIMDSEVQGSGFRVLGSKVQGSGFRGSGFWVQRFKVLGSEVLI
jgi:hypothetical protein